MDAVIQQWSMLCIVFCGNPRYKQCCSWPEICDICVQFRCTWDNDVLYSLTLASARTLSAPAS